MKMYNDIRRDCFMHEAVVDDQWFKEPQISVVEYMNKIVGPPTKIFGAQIPVIGIQDSVVTLRAMTRHATLTARGDNTLHLVVKDDDQCTVLDISFNGNTHTVSIDTWDKELWEKFMSKYNIIERRENGIIVRVYAPSTTPQDCVALETYHRLLNTIKRNIDILKDEYGYVVKGGTIS